ncbi:MAG TPA: hypothetical protein VEL12_14085 [Candidatus Nitrosopolaris sp.]|nr:hypothetical protein [Candidatus Nitrosopolaris sp.]
MADQEWRDPAGCDKCQPEYSTEISRRRRIEIDQECLEPGV